MIGYIAVAFIVGAIFGFCGIGIMAAVGKQNACEEAYEKGKRDALKEVNLNECG